MSVGAGGVDKGIRGACLARGDVEMGREQGCEEWGARERLEWWIGEILGEGGYAELITGERAPLIT